MKRRDFLKVSALAGAAASGFGQPALGTPAAAPPLRQTLQRLSEEAHLAGAIVAVTQNGLMASLWTTGFASLPFSAPVDNRTLFHLGSIGKHITALAVMQLVEQGRVDLDQPVGRYVPKLPPAWAARPVRVLLWQTSGLPDYTDVLPDFSLPQPRETVMAAIGHKPMEFEPGEAWTYSNTNYLLLGWLIEDVAHTSYAEMLETNLFARAGTPRARADDSTAIIPNRAEPYYWDKTVFRHAPQMDSAVSQAADGGVLFSALDFAPWTAALTSDALLSAGAMKEATSAAQLNTGRHAPYGFGWFLAHTRERKVLMHTGSVPGYTSVFVVLPEQKLSVGVATNTDCDASKLRAMAWHALEDLAPGSTFISLSAIARAPEDDKLKSVLAAGADVVADDTIFAREWRLILSNKDTRNRVMTHYSRDVEVTPLEVHDVPGGRMRRYRIESSDESGYLTAGFDQDGKIFWIYTI